MPFDYDKDRMSEKDDRVTRSAYEAVDMILKEVLVRLNSEPGPMLVASGSMAIPGLVAVAKVMSSDNARRNDPSPDEITFAACYMIASVEHHPGGLMVGFSPEIVDKAQGLYRKLMGRDYPYIEPSLQKLIDNYKKSANLEKVPDSLQKFLR
jgi:hypothetical protein